MFYKLECLSQLFKNKILNAKPNKATDSKKTLCLCKRLLYASTYKFAD